MTAAGLWGVKYCKEGLARPEFDDPVQPLEYISGEEGGASDLRSFAVCRSPSNWSVNIAFRADDSFSAGMIRAGIERNVMDSFHAVFTPGDPVDFVNGKAFMPLIDHHGNETDRLA
jgi:hypothetical protein